MAREPLRIQRWVRENPRRAIAAYLAAVSGLVLLLALDTAVFGIGNDFAAWSTQRWTRRVDQATALLAANQPAAAADQLERLDRQFPARHVKHALDRDRERLLAALAQAYEATDRPERARTTLERLAAFDPRNHRNHLALAHCLIRQRRAGEAEAPLRRALEIAPYLRGATRDLIGLLAEGGRDEQVLDAFERHVDAVVFCEITLAIGDQRVSRPVPVDGREHTVSCRLTAQGGADKSLTLFTDGHAVVIGATTITPLHRVGRSTEADPVERPPSAWTNQGMRAITEGAWVAPSEGAALALGIPDGGSSHVEITVRLPVPVDAATFGLVEAAAASVLQPERVTTLRKRLLITDEELPR